MQFELVRVQFRNPLRLSLLAAELRHPSLQRRDLFPQRLDLFRMRIDRLLLWQKPASVVPPDRTDCSVVRFQPRITKRQNVRLHRQRSVPCNHKNSQLITACFKNHSRTNLWLIGPRFLKPQACFGWCYFSDWGCDIQTLPPIWHVLLVVGFPLLNLWRSE